LDILTGQLSLPALKTVLFFSLKISKNINIHLLTNSA